MRIGSVFVGYSSLRGFYHRDLPGIEPKPRLTRTGADAYTKKLDGLHIIDDCACFGLPVPDRGGSAAEREGGGLGRSVRRHGLANGVRSARVGDTAFEGDDGVGD